MPLKGAELETHYIIMLRELGKEKGILGQIFTKSQNKIQDPAKLSKIIAMIDSEQWLMMGVKDKGDIYEGLLEKNAEDTKSGAGQYFKQIRLTQKCTQSIIVHLCAPNRVKLNHNFPMARS